MEHKKILKQTQVLGPLPWPTAWWEKSEKFAAAQVGKATALSWALARTIFYHWCLLRFLKSFWSKLLLSVLRFGLVTLDLLQDSSNSLNKVACWFNKHMFSALATAACAWTQPPVDHWPIPRSCLRRQMQPWNHSFQALTTHWDQNHIGCVWGGREVGKLGR